MGNTNFQTIHQMGTAISNMVKQATGRDNVQNIDMEHITVAQNHHYEEVDLSGQVVSFQAEEAGLPFEKMVVQIKPVQDLHGYEKPWPAGGGKNKLNPLTVEDTNMYIMATTGATYIPTPEGGTWRASDYIPVTAGDILFFGEIFAAASLAGSAWYDSNKSFVSGFNATSLKNNNGIMTVPEGVSYLRHSWRIDERFNTNWETTLYITLNSDPHEFSPYSNICPITGWTMVNVYQAGENMEDARVYRVTFPSEAGIVYGGSLDVVSGELSVDLANIASYNGETLPGEWISDRDVYAEGTTPTTGAQVVYQLATPLTYQLTPQEITTLLGQNYIWADTGDIEVKFTNVKEMY